MSLYDDFEPLKQKANQVAGWSSGIKLFQSQMQLKKATQTQPRRETPKKPMNILAPVIDLKGQRNDDDSPANMSFLPNTSRDTTKFVQQTPLRTHIDKDMEWSFQGAEYDPMWPNDYDKAARDIKEMKDREREKEDEERKRRREERNRKNDQSERRRASDSDDDEPAYTPAPAERKGGAAIAPPPSLQESTPGVADPKLFGASVAAKIMAKYGFKVKNKNYSDDDEPAYTPAPAERKGGAAIAPLPSLQESTPGVTDPKLFGASVAAKIMAKYGFKEGQGLGKKEQGMSMALQVEKTSKRGGRIIHEKDIMPPPSFLDSPSAGGNVASPTHIMPPPPTPGIAVPPAPEPSITEIMKSPSKVVLLRNMVGPGEVDTDLEPEVKDECNTKYGDVVRVIIHELPNAVDDEAVRIFVEFKRIESAIKAVVDLNGRFFGGRQVKAGFYSFDRLDSLQLLD